MGTSARAIAAGAAACAALVIAGCGSSGSMSSPSAPASGATTEPAATALLTSMAASVRQASSVHIAGFLSNNGIPISVDLNMHRNGDVSGTVSQNGAPFEVLGVNGTTYIKATPAFLRAVKAPASTCSVVCGKWLQLTPAQASQLTGDLSMSSLTAPLSSSQVPKLAETGAKTIGGQLAWGLRAANGSTLYVSSGSSHYPVAATTGGHPNQVVTYSQWNSAPKPVPPPASEVLNLHNLK
jgi:hypothetical protein